MLLEKRASRHRDGLPKGSPTQLITAKDVAVWLLGQSALSEWERGQLRPRRLEDQKMAGIIQSS